MQKQMLRHQLIIYHFLQNFEIFGARNLANQYEQNKQAQYTYFAISNSKIKYNHSATNSAVDWLTRSARYDDSQIFVSVSESGTFSCVDANSSRGLTGAFLV